MSVAQRVAGTSVSRWVPLAGAAAVGAYAYWDTLQVARTAAKVLATTHAVTRERDALSRTPRRLAADHVRTVRTAQPSGRDRARVRPRVDRRPCTPRYNIAPMTEVPIVRVNAEGQRELVRMRWGLVPRWAKDPSIGARMINARGETIADKPSFQMPYRRHRCLLPADGFYEWQAPPRATGAGEAARKQPLHIGMADGSLFGLAGLYERWRSEDGKVLDTCTIVTTAANALLAPIHDRMPLIVRPPALHALARSRQ